MTLDAFGLSIAYKHKIIKYGNISTVSFFLLAKVLEEKEPYNTQLQTSY